MRVLIDTNVILDVFLKREPHYEASATVLRQCGSKLTGCISASQTTDLFYLLTRAGWNVTAARDVLKKITQNINVLDITPVDVNKALVSPMPDYEDALLDCQSKRHKVRFIITRNEKDFAQAQVSAISPQRFLEQFYNG